MSLENVKYVYVIVRTCSAGVFAGDISLECLEEAVRMIKEIKNE